MKNKILCAFLAMLLLMPDFYAAASENVYTYYRPAETAEDAVELLTTGSFDAGTTGWSATGNWEAGAPTSLVYGDSPDGGYCVKMVKSDGNNPYVCRGSVGVTAGKEYRLSAYLKKSAGLAAASFNRDVVFKIEYYGAAGNIGLEGHAAFGDIPDDDNWYYVQTYFTPPQGCTGVAIYARLFAAGTVYFDKISCIEKKQDLVLFETDNVFYYTDMQIGTATVRKNPAADASAVSSVYFAFKKEGMTLAEANESFSEGTAAFSFSLSLMTEGEAYTVECKSLDADGNVLYTDSETVYRYARPSALGSDGVYRKNGQPFIPVIGYHVANGNDASLYPYCVEAGINVVQFIVSNPVMNAEAILAKLDTMQENGLMAFVGLYSSMEAADQIAVINLVKNHSAVFGYMMVDEPTLNGVTLEYLTELYRRIRDNDTVHPAYIVESPLTAYNYREIGKRTDILAVDPYAGGSEKMLSYITEHVEMAKAAVENKKPVYCINEIMTKSWSPAPDDIRNMHYQALMAGADGLGYYDVQDVYGYKDGEKEHMWQRDGYPGVLNFAKNEATEAFAAFIRKEYEPICENKTGDVWWKCFGDENEIYCVVLNRTNKAQETEIENIRVGDFTEVSVLGGVEKTDVAVENILSVRLPARGTAVFRLSFRYAENGGTSKVWLSYSGRKTEVLQEGTARLICDSGNEASVFTVAFYTNRNELITFRQTEGRFLETEADVPETTAYCKIYIWDKTGILRPLKEATVFSREKEV